MMMPKPWVLLALLSTCAVAQYEVPGTYMEDPALPAHTPEFMKNLNYNRYTKTGVKTGGVKTGGVKTAGVKTGGVKTSRVKTSGQYGRSFTGSEVPVGHTFQSAGGLQGKPFGSLDFNTDSLRTLGGQYQSSGRSSSGTLGQGQFKFEGLDSLGGGGEFTFGQSGQNLGSGIRYQYGQSGQNLGTSGGIKSGQNLGTGEYKITHSGTQFQQNLGNLGSGSYQFGKSGDLGGSSYQISGSQGGGGSRTGHSFESGQENEKIHGLDSLGSGKFQFGQSGLNLGGLGGGEYQFSQSGSSLGGLGGGKFEFTKTGHSTGGSGGGKYESSYSYGSGGGGGYFPGGHSSGGGQFGLGLGHGKHSENEGSEFHEMGFTGGCGDKPKAPQNTKMMCSMTTGCKIQCLQDYKFPNGDTTLFLQCIDKEWQVKGTEWETIPSCEPICLPECLHNGICVAPGQCRCADGYNGPQCQYEKKKPCLNFPPMPSNSKRSCSSTSCTISCQPNHQFSDGSSVTNMVCRDGSWVPSRPDWVKIPDCLATCSPPCINGGSCLSYNVCQCPQEFRGDQCQYSVTACSAKKLNFNGGYNCSGTMDKFSCSLSCPSGIKFDSPPAPVYTCDYATGVFVPSNIPQCVFEVGMEVFQIDGMGQVFSGEDSEVSEHHKHSGQFGQHGQHGYGQYGKWNKSGGWHSGVSEEWGEGQTTIINQFEEQENIEQTFTETSEETHDLNFSSFEKKDPKPGICFTWSGPHYKTFDGKVYSFDSNCAYTLLRDNLDNTFSIVVRNSPKCVGEDPELCHKIIKIYVNDKEYTLTKADGKPVFSTSQKVLAIPSSLPGIRVETSGHYLRVQLDDVGVSLKWDMKQIIAVETTDSMWGKAGGLCGTLDGHEQNDWMGKDGKLYKTAAPFVESWKVEDLNEGACITKKQEEGICTGKKDEAVAFCKKLLANKNFDACFKVHDAGLMMDACIWDYCSCQNSDRSECACRTLTVFAAECAFQGIKIVPGWRDHSICPMKCTGGRSYRACGPDVQETCGSVLEKNADSTCEEGCYCPENTALHEGECIPKSQCPCKLRGRVFKPGQQIPRDCNTCTCLDGKWTCTDINCGSRCSAVGDPHYTSFDGRRFDFMGKCSYYLIKGDNYSIEAENVACSGAISEAMNLAPSTSGQLPSCTKTVTVQVGDQRIKLKSNREVTVNDKDVAKLPAKLSGVVVRPVSSAFVVVELENGLEIWWDGMTRVYIDAPASFRHKTQGLCGTFNSNQKDDFLTPEGDVEQSTVAFANKWKTTERCDDITPSVTASPCSLNPQNKPLAETYCKKLKSDLFANCHWHVDPEVFYENCLYDVCSCNAALHGGVGPCLCPIIAAYATECALAGVIIDWRSSIDTCAVTCPPGQVHEMCGDSCTLTCQDLWSGESCRRRCAEGCRCPEGQAISENGECIPIGQCPCVHAGLEFVAGYKEVRPGRKSQELCTCIRGNWNCRKAEPSDITEFPPASDLRTTCFKSKNQEFTTCEPAEPITCRNMDTYEESSNAVCRPGCQCKKGYVLDTTTKECIEPKSCPCHHGGRSYQDGETMQEECNTCSCNHGSWTCSNHNCVSICSAWGDSHFKTFDGRLYDFQGACDYIFAKGALSPTDAFEVIIQNVPCSSIGITCSKSVVLKVGSESVTLSQHSALPDMSSLKRITLRTVGHIVFLEVYDLGLVLQWDRGTTVYVKLDTKWKGRTKGLCGDYDNDEQNDFVSPSGGRETSAVVFGDSWKIHDYCEVATAPIDTCEKMPNRMVWSQKKCGVLKRKPFARCHSEVPVEPYLTRCLFDTCACDQGGDCECLCTALAAYAQECARRGVAIKWRSQELCPMQCDESCSEYSPCISACPAETCDSIINNSAGEKICEQDTCVEGCKPKPCPDGQVYLNDSTKDCVPKAECKPVCLEEDGVVYYEGDKMEEDNCHSCFCSRKKKVCQGQPCTTLEPPVVQTKVPPLNEQMLKCVSGWTGWINSNIPSQGVKTGKGVKGSITSKANDIEPLPSFLELAKTPGSPACGLDDIKGIKCRTVKLPHLNAKATGYDVECSLEKGLVCRGSNTRPCTDFEISVLCVCEDIPTTVTKPTTARPEIHETTVFNEFLEDKTTTISSVEEVFDPKVPTTTVSHVSFKPEVTPKPWYTTTVAPKIDVTVAPDMPPCDEIRPNEPYPGDCYMFYQCVRGLNGLERVVKTCGPHMMYNPETMVCDWPYTVEKIRSDCGDVTTSFEIDVDGDGILPGEAETTTFRTDEVDPEPVVPSICGPGEIWSNCAIPCDRACMFYSYILIERGLCSKWQGSGCKEGCVSESREKECGPGRLWRDENKCVEIADCTCRSDNGRIVAPGELIYESECKICQCINNQYTCDDNACKVTYEPPFETESTTPKVTLTTIITPTTTPKEVIIVPSTSSPPKECLDVVPLSEEEMMGDEAYEASSTLNDHSLPKYAKLDSTVSTKSAGSWSPEVANNKQYLQINLPRLEPVYGVIVKGGPLFSEYVTSYKVLHSTDGIKFSYVIDEDGKPKVFRGSVDQNTPVKQQFKIPFEAKVVRINPQTWYGGISLRADVLVCESPKTKPPPTTVITTTTPAPPKECLEVVPLSEEEMLGDEAYEASTILGNYHLPKYGRIDSKQSAISSGSWSPEQSNKNQYFQINLPRLEPVYGVIIKGSPLYTQYVTSYKVSYSTDGLKFNDVTDENGVPKIFSGSKDTETPARQQFKYPVDAKSIRINPLTWNQGIALRADLLICSKGRTTPVTEVTTTKVPEKLTTITHFTETPAPEEVLCTDILTKTMDPRQIIVTSTKTDKANFWQPLVNSPIEFIIFDFLGPRILTGMQTLGSPNGWVTVYKLHYSHDKINWNPMLNLFGNDKEFLGNYDSKTPKDNIFDKPLNARYLKLTPVKWDRNIVVKANPLGCFEAYPEKEFIPPFILPPDLPKECKPCPGVSVDDCKCKEPLHWDGEDCVTRAECPCIVGHIPYNVGTQYESEDCSQCTCHLNGIPSCQPKVCEPCPQGLRSVLTPTCGCLCKPCEDNERLCPTSNICIPEKAWCNGLQDCPDDEVNCATTIIEIEKTTPTDQYTEPPTTVEPTTEVVTKKPCPVAECRPGYKLVFKSRPNSYSSRYDASPMLKTGYRKGGYSKGGAKGGRKGRFNPGSSYLPKPQRIIEEPKEEVDICPQFRCISTRPPPPPGFTPEPCPEEECPAGYQVVLEPEDPFSPSECPQYSCLPPPKPDFTCNVTGRTFTTFDGTEFKYDICSHIIARDLRRDSWNIKLQKNCSVPSLVCPKELVITQDGQIIKLKTDLTLSLNGYDYNVDQTQKIGFSTNTFFVSRLGDTLFFVSNSQGFWVIWNRQADIKLGVSAKLSNTIDGLCGFFNHKPEDDKQRPDGSLARNTQEFGDSWNTGDVAPAECEPHVCPQHLQEQAWKMCNIVKERSLAVCSAVVNLNKWISKCLETVCTCLQESLENEALGASSKCKCQALLGFVSECQSADKNVDLLSWRTEHNCPAECPAPLVHRDCYRRRCELSCESIRFNNDGTKKGTTAPACPMLPGVCFSGCYCPEGTVRKGDSCVLPTECRDCVCDGFGNAKYVTYDQRNFTFDGNCTYLLTRDIKPDGGHTFQVYVTNGDCIDGSPGTCTQAVTLIYGPHVLLIKQGKTVKQLLITLDGTPVSRYPLQLEWIKIESMPGRDITVMLPDAQLELSSFFHNMALMVRVPSRTYAGNLEGLCGDCDGEEENDFKKPNGKITTSVSDFGMSWLNDDSNIGLVESDCMYQEKPKPVCPPLPADQDGCLAMLNPAVFGQCNMIVDPTPYVVACQQEHCTAGKQVEACGALEGYARECKRHGICVDWRIGSCKLKCPPGLQYKACGLGCDLTCSNLEYLKDPSLCEVEVGEGCFCSEGQVRHNETCIAPRLCKPCDKDGHFAGDQWEVDKCTSCLCNAFTLQVQCSTTECPDKSSLCQQGQDAVKLPNTEDECCDKFMCVARPVEPPPKTCEEPKVPECGTDQEVKLETKEKECPKYVCQCIAPEKCPPLKNQQDLPPGFKKIVTNNGCCDTEKLICKPELCPERKTCPEFYELITKLPSSEDQCCPEYKCELPKNKCIPEIKYIGSVNGGQILRKESDIVKSLKEPGEIWQDGPCRECKCVKDPINLGEVSIECVARQCPSIYDHPDYSEYELIQVPEAYECCAIIKRKACRHAELIYQINESWLSDDDACKSIVCLESFSGDIVKVEKEETCQTKCPKGYVYEPPSKSSRKCCGKCVQKECVQGDILYKPEQTWKSEDNCTTFECTIIGDQYVVSVRDERMSCPDISDCKPENRYSEGCCVLCKLEKQDQLNCAPEEKKPETTIGLVKQTRFGAGVCYNTKPIPRFTECKGACPSGTIYNSETSRHDKDCKCCIPVEYDSIVVQLTCEDGSTTQKQVAVPKTCSCNPCEEQIRSGTKTKGVKSTFPGVKTSHRGLVETFNPDDLQKPNFQFTKK